MKTEFEKQSRQEMRRLGIENEAAYEEYKAAKVITKDSGKRQDFETGARRDTQDGKPRFDLIPIDMLDLIQQSYGGAPLDIDATQETFTGWVNILETRYDLIPGIMLNRLGGLYHRGALKYDDDNWKKGIPLSRIYASLLRHTIEWRAGDTSEDHLAAILWNATALMWTLNAIAEGKLPEELNDIGIL